MDFSVRWQSVTMINSGTAISEGLCARYNIPIKKRAAWSFVGTLACGFWINRKALLENRVDCARILSIEAAPGLALNHCVAVMIVSEDLVEGEDISEPRSPGIRLVLGEKVPYLVFYWILIFEIRWAQMQRQSWVGRSCDLQDPVIFTLDDSQRHGNS